MIESKLSLIGDKDRERWKRWRRNPTTSVEAPLASAAHEDEMVQRHARVGSVITIRNDREIPEQRAQSSQPKLAKDKKGQSLT